MTIKYEGNGALEQGHDAGHAPDKGFERWLARRSAKAAAPTTDDWFYQQYVAQAMGADAQDAAGVVLPEAPGMGAVVFSEAADMDADEACKIYIGELDDSNAKNWAEENVCQERRDSAEEHRHHSRERSYPMRTRYHDRD